VLNPYPSHNSRDTFWATTQGTPASWPSRYHQSLVDHTHQKQANHFCLNSIAWRCSRVTRRASLLDRLAGDTCRHAPSAITHPASTSIAWRNYIHRKAPHEQVTLWNHHYRLAVRILPPGTISAFAQYEFGFRFSHLFHPLLHLVTQLANLSSLGTLRVPIILYQHHNHQS